MSSARNELDLASSWTGWYGDEAVGSDAVSPSLSDASYISPMQHIHQSELYEPGVQGYSNAMVYSQASSSPNEYLATSYFGSYSAAPSSWGAHETGRNPVTRGEMGSINDNYFNLGSTQGTSATDLSFNYSQQSIAAPTPISHAFPSSHRHSIETVSSSVTSDDAPASSASVAVRYGEPRSDPPTEHRVGEPVPRRQSPRFADDAYTPSWVKGEGIERAGWCGLCSTWHKLKDSAYWYHLQFAHGISCATGKPFENPKAWRQAQGTIGIEALCGGCSQWILVGRVERWRTPYFRHAYKCQASKKPTLRRSGSRVTSPRRLNVTQARSL